MQVESKYLQQKRGGEKLCHVYIHCRPDETPFYVGIGRGKRCYNFNSRSLLHQRTVAKIREAGGEVIVKIDRTCTIEEAILREKELIALYGRKDIGTGILVNHSDGGEFVPEKGRVRSSDVLKGNKNRLGTIQSGETRKKIGEASKKAWENAEERRKKNSERLAARNKDPDFIAKSAAGRTGLKRSMETRKKMSEDRIGRPGSKKPKTEAAKQAMRDGWAKRKACLAPEKERKRKEELEKWTYYRELARQKSEDKSRI